MRTTPTTVNKKHFLASKRTFLGPVFSSWVFLTIAFAISTADACTSVLVTRGASADGSVIITYHADDAGAYATLSLTPAADHKPGDTIDIPARNPAEKTTIGKIPQVPHTYKVLGGLMNEHQLSISETTFECRKELTNPNSLLSYELMIQLGLQRAKTAREAIEVMTKLAEEFGFAPHEGETISIADTQEAWILEMVGNGLGERGVVWAAMRVPDGQICCHANQSRLAEIPRDDPANWMYSKNLESVAIAKGWYDPASGKPFSFCDAYAPPNPLARRICDARVWSVFRRAAPSQHFSTDYIHSKPDSKPYPLSIVPDKKLSAADVFALIRDHFEATEFDTTQGVDAGPYGAPLRWRPLVWKVDGEQYTWERPISTQQTAFSSVTQSRAWLPNAIGGLVWFGIDDSYTTCYLPFYCGIDALPKSFTGGSIERYSRDSAWWVFNLTANIANLKYSYMLPEIQAVQKEIESDLLALQPAIEKTAIELSTNNPNLMTRYLTDYSVTHAELTVDRWRELGEHLITKYNDGYIRDSQGKYPDVGYPEAWLRRVLKERPDHFKVPQN
jgi:dipeptidase